MKCFEAMLLSLAMLAAPIAAQAQIRTGEPQRVPAEPQRVSPEPQRVPAEPQRVGDAGAVAENERVILAVPSESALADALRESFESGQPLIGWGIGALASDNNDDAALPGDLVLVVGPIGQEQTYYNIRLTNANVAQIRQEMPGGDVAMEEFVIAYEDFELARIPAQGILDWHKDMIVVGKDAILVEPDLDALFGAVAPADVAEAAPALPDLQIRTAGVDPATPQEVKVRVVNTGAGPSAATRVRVWVIPQGKAWYGVMPALAAGQDAWVTVHADMPVMAAEHVYARADDPNKVTESDEGNNGHVLK